MTERRHRTSADSNPEMVLADEPTAALDSDSRLLVVNIYTALGHERGVTTMMITHDDCIQRLAEFCSCVMGTSSKETLNKVQTL